MGEKGVWRGNQLQKDVLLVVQDMQVLLFLPLLLLRHGRQVVVGGAAVSLL